MTDETRRRTEHVCRLPLCNEPPAPPRGDLRDGMCAPHRRASEEFERMWKAAIEVRP